MSFNCLLKILENKDNEISNNANRAIRNLNISIEEEISKYNLDSFSQKQLSQLSHTIQSKKDELDLY